MKLGALLLLYVVMALGTITKATDYCNPDLCKGLGKHIACKADTNFALVCPADAEMVNITKNLQNLILSEINQYRNYIAGGGDSNHSPACRMATMQWCKELAALAALKVKQCSINHDDCHNTDFFQYAGQNLAWMSFNGPLKSEVELRRVIKLWYDEVATSTMKNIRKYPSYTTGHKFGHFTALMVDKNIRVGCAASTYSSECTTLRNFSLACNFASNNYIDYPTYKDCSNAGADCSTGTNPQYPKLCSTSEVYEVNKWF